MEESRFGEQELAVRLLDHHREPLVAEARKMLMEHPGACIVGVVMAPDSREAAQLRSEYAKAGHAYPANAAIAMLWPREAALALLRATTPAQLDWLESDAGKLPLVCVTRSGTRLGWAPLHEVAPDEGAAESS